MTKKELLDLVAEAEDYADEAESAARDAESMADDISHACSNAESQASDVSGKLSELRLAIQKFEEGDNEELERLREEQKKVRKVLAEFGRLLSSTTNTLVKDEDNE